MSTDELHERIYAPYGLTGLGLGSFVPLAVVALVSSTRR